MPKIVLKSCPKRYILETHRAQPPDSTLAFVHTMREIIGMQDLLDATHLDRIGIPVFTCSRTRPDNSVTNHTGKGISAVQAQCSLTVEAIERYCSEFCEEYRPKLIRGSYNDLRSKQNTLNPESLIISQLSEYTGAKEISWVRGFDLHANEEILVPACAVYHPFPDGEFLFNTHTNGIAAGNTLEEAVVHGLAEVIERDAWSITQYRGDFRDALFLEDTGENRFIIEIFEKLERAQIEIVAKDITSDIGIPVVGAFSRDLLHGAMLPIDGFGAHLDPRVAMVRALLEIATTRALFIQKHGFEGLREHISDYLHEEELEDPRFFASSRKGLAEMEAGYSDDILDDIKTYLTKLRSRDLRAIAVDLTRKDVNVPAVRIIIPGAEVFCFDRTRKGDRLFQEPDVA